jgi:hypothetical protein
MPRKRRQEKEKTRYILVQGTKTLLWIDRWTLVHFPFFEKARVLRVCSSENEARKEGEEYQVTLRRSRKPPCSVVAPDGRIFARWNSESEWRDLTDIVLSFF